MNMSAKKTTKAPGKATARAPSTSATKPAKNHATKSSAERNSGAGSAQKSEQTSGSKAAAARRASSLPSKSTAPSPDAAPRSKNASPRYWLLKTEAECFGFDDLARAPGKRTGWDGVRNYQARNFLRDSMSIGDLVLYYHSNAEPSGIAGIARIASAAYPDPTQFDPAAEHFDPKSRREDPPWMQVDVEAVLKLPRFVSLEELKRDPRLARMLVLQRGQRLSVLPVEAGEWRVVLELAGVSPSDF
jgi:predicted RNA-binding protein with PUA-like domain